MYVLSLVISNIPNRHIVILGDAELVIMLDPLGMLNDSNPCNNFVRMNVYVDCAGNTYLNSPIFTITLLNECFFLFVKF